jgi:arylsulfatase A-like enzyme
MITADHGGSGSSHGSDSPEDMTIPWLAVGPGVPAGITLQGKIVVYDTAATALYALGLPIPEEWDGRPVLEIFEGDQKLNRFYRRGEMSVWASASVMGKTTVNFVPTPSLLCARM